ncbi:MAG: ATP-binding protein [Nanoarchaeota archaeon]|nr:ATP-binding protein [Nanoarchaeota archaeon]
MDIIQKIKGNSAKIQTSLSTIIKMILIIAIFYATYSHYWHILLAYVFLLLLLFMPNILRNKYHVRIPFEFEFIVFIFVIISFFLGSIGGYVINIFFGVIVGFIGFAIMLIIFSHSKFKTNYLLIILFSFAFSMTFGLAAEMLKYYIKLFLSYENINADHPYTMLNLTCVALGAFISSIIGYVYMKGFRVKIMQDMVGRFKNHNPNFFIQKTDSPEEVIKLIKKGENERLEFKSTLRTNLHIGEHDKKVENAALKTIIAFLNSEGGHLLIGVDDKGEIIGIEKDSFENNDRFNRHFTNLLKERIGNEYLPYINSELIIIEEKSVLKVECRKSDKPVFLKCDGNEEFYIRVGASSLQIIGSKMLEYIEHKFKKI